MGLAATVHVCAVIPNFRIAEYFVNFTEPCEAVSTQRIEVKDGWAELPETPGLGVEIDVAKLRTHPYREFAHKKLTEDWQEYPRKDYVVAR
jgi:galactonate dehydratase